MKRAKEEGWVIWSLRDGIGELAEALENHLVKSGKVEIRKDTPCDAIAFEGGKAKVIEMDCIYVKTTLIFLYVELL